MELCSDYQHVDSVIVKVVTTQIITVPVPDTLNWASPTFVNVWFETATPRGGAVCGDSQPVLLTHCSNNSSTRMVVLLGQMRMVTNCLFW